MGTPHKHAEVIKAWADGAQIQVYSIHSNRWLDLTNSIPAFTSERYRVKPATLKYRVALFQSVFHGGYHTDNAHCKYDAEDMEGYTNFVRWLTDWIEVDI